MTFILERLVFYTKDFKSFQGVKDFHNRLVNQDFTFIKSFYK